ncbi:hypothetical protein QBC47DRAFT_441829 [Echria macrotheca]|uniref:Uncharacterized protein n=1 Tax=Echria macrotheca TaxID=438768 RepID=A0AAJ0F0Z5_9PEZI|nr:hypothetical protein QBC47DRAFT_441829 [Echria macrotheca]
MLCLTYMQRYTVQFDHWGCISQLIASQDVSVIMRNPPQAEISQILDARGIPVIRLARPSGANGGHGPISVEVREGKTLGTNYYIVVSPVSSDGLGNPRTNSLSYCQLESLYERLHEMARDTAYAAFESGLEDIGYDTDQQKKIQLAAGKAFKASVLVMKGVVSCRLCVRTKTTPCVVLDDTLCVPLEQLYRNMAISRIKEAYAFAHMTIVLDSELQTF